MVEMVPSPWTDLTLMEKAKDLLRGLGQSPVTLKKEIPGFIAPRVQNAMIMECIRLVLVSKPSLNLKVLVTTIAAQWEGMGDVGSVRYELALLPPCPTIRFLIYSN